MDKSTLGDYTIIKQIGHGTLGSVYLAEHRFVKKHYVLKVLPEELASDRNFIQRFEKNIALLAQLDHPHVVKVHNVSFSEGYYFLVTDCIVDCFGETTNLMQYLGVNKQSLNENEIFDLLLQVSSALSYIHSSQLGTGSIVHRGLKLNNILIGKGDKGLHVYLSDCGLSQIVGEGAVLTRMYKNLADILSLTDVTQPVFKHADEEKYMKGGFEPAKLSKLHVSFLQTYQFLAPEQKIYRDRSVSAKADVYAFGVLTYFLLTHSFPEGCFSLPSQVCSDLRLDWDRLIQECLAPDPTLRPDQLVERMQLMTNHSLISEKESKEEALNNDDEILDWNQSSDEIQESNSLSEEPLDPLPSEEHHPNTAVMTEQVEDTLMPVQTDMLQEVSKLVRGHATPVLNPQEIQRPEYDPDPASIFHKDSSVARYIPQEKETKNIKPLQTDMEVVSGGEYLRGSDSGGRDERPRHSVVIKSFALDVHPVSNEQFVRFLESMGGEKDANNNDIIKIKDSRIRRQNGTVSIESGYSKHPVIGVTWYGAIGYAKWVGKRLPTEAEWEIAASSGQDVMYPTGPSIERTQANFFSSDTMSVKSYPPNEFGFYDMVGNVYEWCQDWYSYNYYEESIQRPDNPQGPNQGVYRVLRGGCWKSLKEDLRCTHRHRNNPGIVNRTYGFRCAADVHE